MTDKAERERCEDLAKACVRHDGDDACYEPVCDICDRDVARITALLVRERAAVRADARAEIERLKAAIVGVLQGGTATCLVYVGGGGESLICESAKPES